jgi:hypothetical protein
VNPSRITTTNEEDGEEGLRRNWYEVLQIPTIYKKRIGH